MTDRYQQLVHAPIGATIAKQLGLPRPAQLRRYQPGDPVTHGPVLLGSAPGGRLLDATAKLLSEVGADVRTEHDTNVRYAALVYDASGITDSTQLHHLRDFFHPVVRELLGSARVLVLGTPPETTDDPRVAAAQRGLEGFVRSVGKEVKGGATANLVFVAEGGEDGLSSTLRFFLSGRSAYVDGQVVTLGAPDEDVVEPDDPDRPQAGRVAVVTGAAQGIGAAIARTLARDGAHVVCVDLPSEGDKLTSVANRIGGSTLQLDITADDAPARLVEHLRERHGGVDVVVHNAGVTRDKTLANMDRGRWDQAIAINLTAQERLTQALLEGDVLREHGRIVCVSSVMGLSGNRGQTNYATSKAGVVGAVEALAPKLAARGATINAVAPGFIETRLTARMPFVAREFGRRANSLAQAGRPIDVAETIAWLAQPGTVGANGETVRVCGQMLIGA